MHRLLLEYLSQFHLAPVMSPEEVEHWLLPQENIIDTYLVVVSTIVKMYTTVDTYNIAAPYTPSKWYSLSRPLHITVWTPIQIPFVDSSTSRQHCSPYVTFRALEMHFTHI